MAHQVAKLFDVSPKTVSRWVCEFRDGGEAALRARKATGRPRELGEAEIRRLRRVIVGKNPAQLNFGVLLWTLPILQQLVLRLFGKKLHPVTVGRYLEQLGLTPQKPLRRAVQRDEKAIRRWVENEFPRIAEDARRKQAVLLFLDETGVHENGPLGTTWGVRGKRPVVKTSGDRTKINVISAVSPAGRLWFRCYRGNLNAARFIEFLDALLTDIRGQIVLVMDSHPAHVAAMTQQYIDASRLRLQVERLPPYAPELNPDEHVWGYLKSLFRQAPLQPGESLATVVEQRMRHIKAQRSLLRSLFGHPDLKYVGRTGHDS